MTADSEEFSISYRELVSQYLFEKYSIRRLDERFLECGSAFLPAADEKDFLPWRLNFISLLNEVHMERMSLEELEEFQSLLEKEDGNTDILDFLERTWEKVLAGTETEGSLYEFYPDIRGKGILPGNALVFEFRDMTQYDSEGKTDWELENEKARVFERVKIQYEKIANAKSAVPVYLVRR